jgi:hypothetical protein
MPHAAGGFSLPVFWEHDGMHGRGVERRTCSRTGFDCPVRWNDGGADRVGWARDASEGNAGFVTRAISAPRVGQSIHLVFELDPDLEWLVDEEAVVARCEHRKDDLCHVGVRLSPVGEF